MRKPIPYAGYDPRDNVRRQHDPLWAAVESGWRRGLTLREITGRSGYPLSMVAQRVQAWLDRRSA